ncbi:hypothetical protein [Haliscomenobacter sp.]|uniref:hypothetical protein n=1 Tax=Haliscomenobacter sp. TaxID=2717303 RepID=UPI00359313B9
MLHPFQLLRNSMLCLGFIFLLLPTMNSSKLRLPVATVEADITFSALQNLKALDQSAPGFKYQAGCQVRGFNLFLLRKKQDTLGSNNPGAPINTSTQQLISMAKIGDRLIFDNIRLDCEGGGAQGVKWGSLGLTVVPD